MKNPILVIMAAGLGSRYGGLKQMAAVDEAHQWIIDYSIYDAVLAGFSKVICIIKPEMEEDFHQTIGRRVSSRIELEYAHQTLDALPKGFSIPTGRTKPWGTAHAVLCARQQIDAAFAVINADDFYGRTAFQAIYDFLKAPHGENEHAMAGYRIENTLTENGNVARGVCEVDGQGQLVEVVERVHVEPREGGAAFTEDGTHFTFVPKGTIVSMNLWGFQHSVLEEMETRFSAFLRENLPGNPLKCEYFLPLVPNQLLHEQKASIRVLSTAEKWYGVTYQQDLRPVRDALAALRAQGFYPQKLWEESLC